jgi:hypothetical protein
VLALFADIPDAGKRVASAIGLTEDAFPAEEIAWGVRRLIEALAAKGPVIMVLDDIHWAERTLLDLAQDLVESVEAPLLLLCGTRRDLLDEHPGWPTSGARARVIDLSPLTEDESNLVLGSLLGAGAVDPAVARWLTAAAEGNPLFLEHMLSMLVDDEAVRQVDGLWVAVKPLEELEVPSTITSLLAARLDRLGPTDRTVIERGAVMGQSFYRGGVEALSPEPVRPLVGESLDSLETKELVRSTGDVFVGLPVYRFQHVLVRDVAYEGMLKRTRADLHASLVDWFEEVAPDRLREFEEIRGYHLEQAYLIFTELGGNEERTRDTGRRGAEHLSSAGRRALARGDMPAASNLLHRAEALLPPGDPQRPRLLLEAGDALIEIGNFTLADELLRKAEEEATTGGDRILEITARLAHLRLRYTMDPEATEPIVEEEVARVLPELEALPLERRGGRRRADDRIRTPRRRHDARGAVPGRAGDGRPVRSDPSRGRRGTMPRAPRAGRRRPADARDHPVRPGAPGGDGRSLRSGARGLQEEPRGVGRAGVAVPRGADLARLGGGRDAGGRPGRGGA